MWGQSMAPWDALTYFQQSVQTPFRAQVGIQSICLANPQRVGLLIATQTTAVGVVFIGTDRTALVQGGIPIGNNVPPVFISHAMHGPLVTYQWFANFGAGADIDVWEIVLTSWPHTRVLPQYMVPYASINGLPQRDRWDGWRSASPWQPKTSGTDNLRP